MTTASMPKCCVETVCKRSENEIEDVKDKRASRGHVVSP